MQLARKHAALVYLVLYHHAWHQSRKSVHASFSQLAEWTGLDYRTVTKTIKYLEWRGFITRINKGTKHSRLDLPGWHIPTAAFDMTREGWVPVPAFIITRYLPANPACVLLPLFLYFQNMSKKNDCWPSTPTLCGHMHWSRRKIYDAINVMRHEKHWRKLGTRLPLPLTLWRRRNQKGELVRHYRVNAVRYDRNPENNLPELFLTPKFARLFTITAKSAPKT